VTDCDGLLADMLTELYGGGLQKLRGNTVGELVNFLKRAVRNRALDHIEKAGRLVGVGDVAELSAPEEPPDVADAECQEFLREEVEKLSRADRELYLMRARGLKEREIAEQTDRPPGTVAAQVARLLERLRQRLRERGC